MYYVEYYHQSQQYTESKLIFLDLEKKSMKWPNKQMTDINNRTKKSKHERHHRIP